MQDSARRVTSSANTASSTTVAARASSAATLASSSASVSSANAEAARLLRHAFFYDGPIAGNSPMTNAGPEPDPGVDWPQGMRGYVLNLTLEGEGLVRDGERCFVCKPSDLILIPPHVPHFYHINNGCETWVHQWIYFYPRSYWLAALDFPLALQQLPSLPAQVSEESLAVQSPRAKARREARAAAAARAARLAAEADKIFQPDEVVRPSSELMPTAALTAESNIASVLDSPYNPMTVVQQIALLEQNLAQNQAQTCSKSEADSLLETDKELNTEGKIGYYRVPQQMWDEFTYLFEAIVERSFSTQGSSQLLAANFLEQILFLRLEQGCPQQPRAVDPRVAISCLYIHDNLCNNNMSIADIAEHAQLSPSRISHLFERNMGLSLIKWRDQERLKLAKSLLLTTELKIEQIAAQIGIQDPGYFFKFFKRNCGLTPNQFRRELKDKLQIGAFFDSGEGPDYDDPEGEPDSSAVPSAADVAATAAADSSASSSVNASMSATAHGESEEEILDDAEAAMDPTVTPR